MVHRDELEDGEFYWILSEVEGWEVCQCSIVGDTADFHPCGIDYFYWTWGDTRHPFVVMAKVERPG